ncbi:MAG: arginine--tRNA ligase [Nanoarchaeota archaeon]
MDFRQKIATLLKDAGVQGDVVLEVPPQTDLGDFAFPCFPLAKQFKKAPGAIAADLVVTIGTVDFLEKVVATGPYLNFFIDKTKRTRAVLHDVFKHKDGYGHIPVGAGKTVVIDYSNPNIGKPMGIHHLGSTVLGHVLDNIHRALGFNVVAVNHLGDWGTQFGVLIAAYKKWGDAKKLQEDPVNYLLSIYVKYSAEEEKDPALHEEAKQWFKKLEQGDEEATMLWKSFRNSNLEYFKRMYKRFGIEFDSYNGEAFYSDKMQPILAALKEKGIAEEDQGALIVRMDKPDVAPLIALKSDGSSTYAMRDLAALKFRFDNYTPHKILYVVAMDQALHFYQLFETAHKLGYPRDALVHVSFGLMRFPEGKMSTRKGKIVFLEDVFDRAVEDVTKIIQEKNPQLANKTQIAEQVGVGAIVFGALLNDRVKDFEFDWDRMLDLQGDTGPYVQYTHARACSVLRKAKTPPTDVIDAGTLQLKAEYELVRMLEEFPDVLASVLNDYKPHILTQYLLKVSHKFNEFYHESPIIGAENADIAAARLLLCDCSRHVLHNGLKLLGLAAPQEM